jgi:hypothetical protein
VSRQNNRDALRVQLPHIGPDLTAELDVDARRGLVQTLRTLSLTLSPDRPGRYFSYGCLFNLGHGITPQAPPAHLAALVEVIKGKG